MSVIATAKGDGCSVTLTEASVVITRNARGKLVAGLAETRIPVKHITGVNHNPSQFFGLARGSVYFATAGVSMKFGPEGRRAEGAMASAHGFAYRGGQRADVQSLLNEFDVLLNR